VVQREMDASGKEFSAKDLFNLFEREYGSQEEFCTGALGKTARAKMRGLETPHRAAADMTVPPTGPATSQATGCTIADSRQLETFQ
jgi:hypothetical protein